jgi:hypothetical protein
MKLEDFEFITVTGMDHRDMAQCVLEFGEKYHLSVIEKKGNYSVEFFELGLVKNPFDCTCTGTINNISKEKINHYILMLTLLSGSYPNQI